MTSLLRTYPLKVKQSTLLARELRRLQKLIQENQSLSIICMQMLRDQKEIIDEIVIMIRTGFPITKSHLNHLVGVTGEILRYLKSNLTDEDFANLNNVSVIKEKFANDPNITVPMLSLVLNYFKIRQFLRSINVPYFDVDENQLVNGSTLLESKTIEKIKSNPDQSQMSTQNDSKPNLAKAIPTNSQSTSQGFSQHPNVSASSQISDLLAEDEDVFAAFINKCDSDEIKEQMPLKNSQKSNQNNEFKKFEAKPPLKMTTSKATTTTAKKRPVGSSKYAIKYGSDSDSDSAETSEPQSKRSLPQWISTSKSKKLPTSTGVPVKKKSFF